MEIRLKRHLERAYWCNLSEEVDQIIRDFVRSIQEESYE